MPISIGAILLIVIIVCFSIYNKVPVNFVLLTAPIIIALLIGYSIPEISTALINQFTVAMNSAGYLLIFALIYFGMLTQTGMFTKLIDGIVVLFGNHMNVVVVMVLSTGLGAVAFLTSQVTASYLIIFPLLFPLYKRIQFDRKDGFILAQTGIAMMCFLPWGIGVINSALFAKCDAVALSAAAMKYGLCFIPVILLQWVYFGLRYKKQHHGLTAMIDVSSEPSAQEREMSPLERPKLFWFNLVLFILVILCLGVFKYPGYLVFLVASVITVFVNYPRDYQELWNKAGATYWNVMLSLMCISVYIGIFEMKRVAEDGTVLVDSMTNALAGVIANIFPEFLSKYFFLIILALVIIFVRFVPYMIINAMYPLMITMGAAFGYSSIAIIAPYVCNLALGTGISPLNPSTHVGCSLLEEDVIPYANYAVPIMTITNLLVLAVAVLTGVLKL